MFKKLSTIGACLLLAAAGMALSSVTQAATPGWYFVSVCVVPANCPSGPAPVWFGAYGTQAICISSWTVWKNSLYGQFPRSLTNCYYQP